MNEFAEVPEFKPDNDKEHKVEAIWDGIIYAKKTDGHLSSFYYLVS